MTPDAVLCRTEHVSECGQLAMHADSHTISAQPLSDESDQEIAERIVRSAYERERHAQLRRRTMPRWLGPTMRALPRVLGIVTVVNGAIGLLAVVAPLLRVALGAGVTAPIYSAYAFICPQRPSHTWFIAGEPMAMEQRMVAMYLAFAVAGLLYVAGTRVRQPLPTGLMLLAVAPVLIDVAISTIGLRPSTAMSRLWTGSLSAFAIAWWAYPRFEAQLRVAQDHVARLRVAERDRTQRATGADSAEQVLQAR
jgi:uncharacterized membrane protein